MIIRNEQEDFSTDQLKLIDRHTTDLVLITLEQPDGSNRVVAYTGIAAQQVYSQVLEHSNIIEAQDDDGANMV